MKGSKNIIIKIIKVVLPIIAVIGLFSYNKLLGIMLILIYILYILNLKRLDIFKIIGSLKYSKGKSEESLKWFKKAYNKGDTKHKTIILYAYMLLRTGNIEKPERILSELLEMNIDNDMEMLAKSNLALVLWKKGNLDGAIDMLNDVYENFKTSTIYGSLGCLLILKGDMDKALKFNLEAYDYNNSNKVILDNLGQTYYLLGKYDEAIEIYQELMETNPAFPEPYYNYGLVLVKKEQTDKALEFMKKSLEYEFSFLNTLSKQEIEEKIKQTEEQLT